MNSNPLPAADAAALDLSGRATPSPSAATIATIVLAMLGLMVLAPAAQAHHMLDISGLEPNLLNGFISGLAHPVLGPDHLLFLLALSLVGLRHRVSWMLALLVCGLAGSALGLLLPGVPGAEALVAFSLVVVGLVLLGVLPRPLLLPAIALHGYVLSASVIGWTTAPITTYLLGLLVSQGTLLFLALTALRRLTSGLSSRRQAMAAAALIGCGAAWTWSGLVG